MGQSKQDSVESHHSAESEVTDNWESSLRADRCRASRFGNPSKTHLSDLHLDISAEGPGPLEHSWHHGEDHSLCLQISATLAGERSGLVGVCRLSRMPITLGVWAALQNCTPCRICACML